MQPQSHRWAYHRRGRSGGSYSRRRVERARRRGGQRGRGESVEEGQGKDMVWAPTKPSVSDKRPVPQFANMYKQSSALRAFSARLFLSFSSCLVFFSSLSAFFFFVVVDVAVLNGVRIGIAVGVEVRFRRGKRPYFRWSRAVFLTSSPHPYPRQHIISL